MTRSPFSPFSRFVPLAFALAAALVAAPAARAQDPEVVKLANDFTKSLSIQDTKGIDRAVKTAGGKAILYYQDVKAAASGPHREEMEARLAALRESFTRLYGKATVLEKL